MMTEITTAGALIVSSIVVIVTTIIVLVAVVFSRSRSRDNSSGGGGVVPVIPNTSSIITQVSSSHSSSRSWKYDVFLSFRGEDTRKTFVDHLYVALEQQGICTYKDDVTLDRGDIIGPSLLKAIQESQIALIVFSENYADSSWCLDELSYIMQGNKERGQIIMPIFYNVDPSDVRKQKGQFGKAFAKHKLSKNNTSKVESWKKALVDASNIAGWEPKHVANGHEAKCIKEIVASALDKLSSFDSVIDDENLVGMEDRLEQLKSQLRMGSGGVRMVGIWGVGGGGKTTLANSLYMELSADFDGCCFVGNIRAESQQHSLQSLQEKILLAVIHKRIEVQSVDIGKQTIKRMLCRRNVLIVLDDVDHLDQLKALAGSLAWFGDGSRIIITTRDEHLLTAHRVDEVSPISLLSHEEAVRLFNMHASNENNLVPDYEVLSQQIVTYAAGLPLALIVLGSFLYDKDKDEWLSTLDRIKDHPEMEIVEKLKISYDGLKPVEKELFLDIACFCTEMEKDEAMAMLDACGFHPRIGVKVLIQKALITVSNGYIHMHDLVQEMGQYIVRMEHPNNPELYSRLWRKEDIEDICSRNATSENDKVEAIDCSDHVCSSSFILFVSNIKKLRFLRVRTQNNHGGPSFLSNELRYIDWRSYPASLFPEGFQPMKLAVLKMDGSLQSELWKGYKYLPYLKELQLVDASKLVKTPDFGGLPCLQKLILNGCQSLEEIHQSLGNHANLVYLSVEFCHKLTRFPTIVQMEKLETLKFSYCGALTEFPKIEANMNSLVELYLDEVGIEVLPSSVGEYCTNLISLKLKWGDRLKSIEGNFHALKCLKKLSLRISLVESSIKQHILLHLPHFLIKLNLSWCELKDGDIPSEIGELFSLQELHLSYNYFTRLDFSLSQLTRLKLLQLNGCLKLVALPELPSSLAILMADCCTSLEDITEDIHTNCEWLCQVSLVGGCGLIGVDKLLESMLQGNDTENRCTSLELEGLEIPDEFIPCMVSEGVCRLELPGNWYNDFSGFLIYAVIESDDYYFLKNIIMKHEKQQGGSMRIMDDSQDVYWKESVNDDVDGNDENADDDAMEASTDDDYDGNNENAVDDYDAMEVSVDDDYDGNNDNIVDDYNAMEESADADYDSKDDDNIVDDYDATEESADDDYDGREVSLRGIKTWSGYVPFGLLRHTSWWDQTSTSISIELPKCSWYGFKLLPKRSESVQIEKTTTYNSSEDDYKCPFC